MFAFSVINLVLLCFVLANICFHPPFPFLTFRVSQNSGSFISLYLCKCSFVDVMVILMPLFSAAKIPFPLTQRFRSMLQNGIDLSTVDVSYVSSRSWYVSNWVAF